MEKYETITIIRPNVSEDTIAAISTKTAGIIENVGGEILKVDKWGLKQLAYPIKKEPNGYYVYTAFSGNGAGIDEMERIFRIDDNVLKYMTIKLDKDFVLSDKSYAAQNDDRKSSFKNDDDDDDDN
ncbi:MAG: 30S ribosomal protein S6 [Proteobacteria bacterium]|nr:30S ribosomal protein S6 [Pseudomonadota bacterium]MBU1640213.1 30S ribosomal protein S6 [Pseudomonadota bacterium]